MEKNSKEIVISRDSLVIEIQEQFNVFYPFLKIEFSTKPKASSSVDFKKYKVSPESRLSKVTKAVFPIKLNVNSDRTIAEVEEDCWQLLGLSIRVCRKSGNVWNDISLTYNWSLESQNKAGEFISTEMSAA
jgi:hypothetical protein